MVGGASIGQTGQASAAGMARANAEAGLNSQVMDAMQGQQAKVETETKMSQFAFNLGKTVRDAWPTGR